MLRLARHRREVIGVPHLGRRMRRSLVPIVAVTALLGGCATVPQTELPDGVTIVVQQNRSDYADGRMQIRVDNASDSDVTITRAVLADPRFNGTAEWTGESRIAAGLVRDLPTDLPDAQCPADDASGTVTLTFVVDGAEGTVEVPPSDPFDMVETVTSTACAAEAVTDAVELTLDDDLGFSGEGPAQVAILSLTALPRGDAEVRLGSVQRTILMQPDDGSAAWSIDRTASSASPADVQLRMVPARCDPHAVAEDKVGTRFPLTAAVDDGEDAVVTLAASDDLKRQIFDYIARRCGWG